MEQNVSNPSFDFDSFLRVIPKEEPKEETKAPEENSSDVKTESTTTQPKENPSNPVDIQKIQGVVNGSLAVAIVDLILSRATAFFMNTSGYQCNFKDMKLSPEEKKEIEPIVDRLVKKYLLKLTDETALAILLCGMYGSKILIVSALSNPQTHQPRTKEAGKDGRGRHKKDCQCEKCKAKKV